MQKTTTLQKDEKFQFKYILCEMFGINEKYKIHNLKKFYYWISKKSSK